MKIRGICPTCSKKKWLLRKRTYAHKAVGRATTQKEICRGCARRIAKMIV